MQLLPAEIESSTVVTDVNWEIPAVEIMDEPRFPYRGMHLDVWGNETGSGYPGGEAGDRQEEGETSTAIRSYS